MGKRQIGYLVTKKTCNGEFTSFGIIVGHSNDRRLRYSAIRQRDRVHCTTFAPSDNCRCISWQSTSRIL